MAFFKYHFTILYAHQVAENPVSYYPDNFIEVDEFRRQLRWLKKRFNVISLSEAYERNAKNDDLRNCLTLTFDDGFHSNYKLIAPILTEEKLPAAFFINNETIDNQSFMWRTALLYLQNMVSPRQLHHALNHKTTTDKSIDLRKLSNLWAMNEKKERLEKLWNGCNLPSMNEVLQQLKPYLTSQQIQAIHQAGFEIGGHTFSHPFCNQLNYNELKHEILNANQDLQKKLDLPIEHFSYPFGNRPEANLEKTIIQESNLKTVLGISYDLRNQNNPHQWNRIKMERTLEKTKRMIAIHNFLGK